MNPAFDHSANTNKIKISEIFGPTIQGEGQLIGQPTVFVRTGGCDYRCSWCDTLYAVESQYRHDWAEMSTEEVWAKVTLLCSNKPLIISLSGGNPAIQPLKPLIMLGKQNGYGFALETQGSIAKEWFAELDVLTLSPKPPSSGMRVDWDIFDQCVNSAKGKPKVVLKIAVLDEEDYAFAKGVAARYPDLSTFLQPVNHTPSSSEDMNGGKVDMHGIENRLKWLIDRVLSDRWFSATVLPQLHVLLWGNKRAV